jgi:hypothetical protein
VSHLWREQIHVALTPSRVVLVRFGRGFSRQVADKRSVPVPAAAGTSWQGAVNAMKSALRDFNAQGADITLIVSNHFVNYLMVPRADALDNPEEETAYARLQFSKTFGALAENWAIRLSSSRNGTERLACGIDQPLLDALREVCLQSGAKLVSVQPYLMAVFNTWRKQLDIDNMWLILAEPEKLCMARFNKGEWRNVRSMRVEPGWPMQLPELLERESRIANADTGSLPQVYLFAPDTAMASVPRSVAAMIKQLQPAACKGFVPTQDADYGMAMVGVH